MMKVMNKSLVDMIVENDGDLTNYDQLIAAVQALTVDDVRAYIANTFGAEQSRLSVYFSGKNGTPASQPLPGEKAIDRLPIPGFAQN